MKKYLARIESAFGDKNFPLWVLATLAIFTMPARLVPITMTLVVTSLSYGYLKRNPGTLKDPNFWQRPELQRFGLLMLAWFLWTLFAQTYESVIEYRGIVLPPLFLTIFCPILAYSTALIQGLTLWPKNINVSKSDANALRKIESWTHASIAGFQSAFIASAIAIAFCPFGPGSWLSGWLLASGVDANLPNMSLFLVKSIDIFGTYAHPKMIVHTAPSEHFTQIIQTSLALVLILSFWSKALNLSSFLALWLKKANGALHKNFVQTFLSAVRSEKTQIELKNSRSFSRNVSSSVSWLLCCYLALFGLFGFSGGPIGAAISGWMNASLFKAYSTNKKVAPIRELAGNNPSNQGIKPSETHSENIPTLEELQKIEKARKPIAITEGDKVRVVTVDGKPVIQKLINNSNAGTASVKKKNKLPKTLWYQSESPRTHYRRGKESKEVQQWINQNGVQAHPKLRIFLAAIIALYGTVPVAVMSAVFLPYLRRKRLTMSKDAILFPEGAIGFLGNKSLRLWSELASVELKLDKAKEANQGKLTVRFRDKSKVELKLAEFPEQQLETFLSAIDENSPECVVSDEVLDLRRQLRTKTGCRDSAQEISALTGEQFQSTIFQTHEPGTYLPDGETRVVRLLASRPLSCVYLARTSSGKLAISKQFFLAGNDEETDAMRKCLQREYELLGKIDHPAIAKVIDVFQRDESTYLLLEHVYGTDLRTLVTAQGARSEEQVYDWALQICSIMSYLHSLDQPIIHRDLTPDNLVLADDGTIRLIDFGAAQRFVEGITGTIIGKQCYVPPEQLQGHATTNSDIYSFAGVLHFLLTGEDPVALTQSDPSQKASVSEELSELVKLCSQFDESLRPESFARVSELLIEAREKPMKEAIRRFKETAIAQDLLPDGVLPEKYPPAENSASKHEEQISTPESTASSDEQQDTTISATTINLRNSSNEKEEALLFVKASEAQD